MKLFNASIVILIMALAVWPVNSSPARSGTEPDLYRVKKIYLETQTSEDLSEAGIAAFRCLHPAMKEALSAYGFVVVNSSDDADAVMYGANTVGWMVLDGPPLDPPKYGFQFWLASSKYKFKWLTEFNISSRAAEAGVGREATRKAAENLFQAWKKSAKKAGIEVGNKLP